MKHVHIGDTAHKEAKDFCSKYDKKLKGTIDKIVLEGVKVLKFKAEQQGMAL